MEFLNPAALYAFFLLPLLLITYLIKRRPRRLVFSSLLLLRDLSTPASGRPWGRLYLPPIFFLQLLLLVLLILALAEPVLSVRPLKVAVILDNSASMQALEGEKSRFELAREQARDLLRGFSPEAQVDLYLPVPRVGRVGGGGLGAGGGGGGGFIGCFSARSSSRSLSHRAGSGTGRERGAGARGGIRSHRYA